MADTRKIYPPTTLRATGARMVGVDPRSDDLRMSHWNVATLIESARVGTDALRANPLRTVLSTTGVIIGVAALVAAFAITDGVEVWSRDMLARESSVQDVAVTPVTMEMVNGRAKQVHGYPVFDME